MTARNRWTWVFAGILLFLGAHAAGQPEAVRCTRMDLTTQEVYTLPVLPPILEESISRDYSVSDLPSLAVRIYVWVKVLQYSGHPEDRIEIVFDDNVVASRTGPQIGDLGTDSWFAWSVAAPVGAVIGEFATLEVRARTRTDMPNNEPTLILVGAIQLSSAALPDGPNIVDTLQDFEYASNMDGANFELPGFYDAPADVFEDVDWPASQDQIARLGGLGDPRFAVSVRYDVGVPPAEGEDEGEGEPEGEVEGEPEPFLETLQLFFGDESLGAAVPLDALPGGYDSCPAGECIRIWGDIPNFLLNTPQRPKVQVNIDPLITYSRLIVDDFTVTYVTSVLECRYPSLVGLGNIVENGGFEEGAFPYVIESPLGQTNCLLISDVIRDIPDACNGGSAAVFDRIVSLLPSVFFCQVEPLIGAGPQNGGTLRVYGLNLAGLTTALLVPEYYHTTLADPVGEGYFRVLTRSGGPVTSGDLEMVPFNIVFEGPFNPAFNGEVICTDGIAQFWFLLEDSFGEQTPELLGCETLIDTVPPVLTFVTVSGDRVPATSGLPDAFPGTYVPANADITVTPLNDVGSDLHVFLNAWTRSSVGPFAAGAPALNDQSFRVQATFFDPPPSDEFATITRSGFILPDFVPATPFDFPDGFAGYAGWNGSSTTPVLITNVPFPVGDGFVYDLAADWQVAVEPTTAAPWLARFDFEARDRANNRVRPATNKNVNINWLWQTRARLVGHMDDITEGPAELRWRLDRGFQQELPSAGPCCQPLARFTLYLDEDGENLTKLGSSAWQRGALRESTVMQGGSFRQWLDANHGNNLCVAVVGADEAGNVQFHPPLDDPTTTKTALEAAEIRYTCWSHEAQLIPNDALDTEVRVHLLHEYFDENDPDVDPRQYGPVTRVPLPPLSQACEWRVNANVWFRTLVPSAAAGANTGVIWKFYKDGVLFARGVVQDNWNVPAGYDLLENMLFAATESNDLVDIEAGALVLEPRSVPLDNYLAEPPDYCEPVFASDYRLGDEGNPPDPDNPNAPSARRREVSYTITAQTVVVTSEGFFVDQTPASARFIVYVREVEEQVRDESAVREFTR